MVLGNLYFRFLCRIGRYAAAERRIEQKPSLRNIRYLSGIYKRKKKRVGLQRLAEMAQRHFPDSPTTETLKKQAESPGKRIGSETHEGKNLTLENVLFICKVVEHLKFADMTFVVKCLYDSFSSRDGFNVKKLGKLVAKIQNTVLKRNFYLLLQRFHPENPTVLLRLAEISQGDRRIDEAHALLSIGCRYSSPFLLYKKFVFELENGMGETAEKTFDDILAQQGSASILRFPMIKRVSALFTPGLDMRMPELESRFYDFVKNYRYDPKTFKSFFDALVRMRRLSELKAALAGIPEKARAEAGEALDGIEQELGGISGIIGLANRNEWCQDLLGLTIGNSLVPYVQARDAGKRCVEFHIPSVFFNQSEEKPTYATVRSFYRNLYDVLHGMEDVVIFPLHQYNWRNSPHVMGEYGISYHTHADEADRKWLHVQESVLNGCCTVDGKGFAGFSSVAGDAQQIEDAVRGVSQQDLEDNFAELHRDYVEQNVSKYAQAQERFHYGGRYVFLPMQVRTDIVAELNRLSSLELLRALVAECPEGLRIVVKRHPFCTSCEICRELEDLKHDGRVIITECSVHSIIEGCEAVFTANSGTGFEALMHGKPVYISGLADYAYAAAGFLDSRESVAQALRSGFAADRQKILRFLYFYNKRYSVPSNDREALKKRLEAWLA